MKREFTPYEIALTLKELGFDNECLGVYDNQTKELFLNDTRGLSVKEIPTIFTLAPTFSQAFDFFEEKYFLSGETLKQAPYQKVTQPYWWYMIQDVNGDDLSDWQNRFGAILDKAHQDIEGNFVDDDEFAKFLYDDKFAFKTRNDAKLECLKKLIEIVKK